MKLINLVAFRKNNNLTQDELARILNVTRAFISQVENGTNNLSDEKIDELFFGPLDLNEGVLLENAGLVPCYDRLRFLQGKLYDTNINEFLNKLHTDRVDFALPFLGLLTENTILQIRHGRSAITDAVADTIVSAFPQVNKEWLTTGKGDMYVDPTKKNVEETKENLQSMNMQLSEKLDSIEEELKEIKEMLQLLLDSTLRNV